MEECLINTADKEDNQMAKLNLRDKIFRTISRFNIDDVIIIFSLVIGGVLIWNNYINPQTSLLGGVFVFVLYFIFKFKERY